MNPASLLPLFVIYPLLGFIISLLLPSKKELLISRTAFFLVSIQLAGLVVFVIYWLLTGHPTITAEDIIILETDSYKFFLDFCFDRISVIYLLVGAFLTFLVAVYSRSYLHREKGYKRFFNTILLFFAGYNLTILSGNLETLFIGWEILGISSFLLIAFYRERYWPVKNAVKVFSIYRIGDAGIILAMWASHHFWHENITFLKFSNYEAVNEHMLHHGIIGIFISLMLLIAAAVKSAQLPFSSWLPRAMEGPTPSSAIFYGSLSVHIGVFLLLRTFPFWEHQLSVRILIGVTGLATSVIANGIARVQSSIKSQIAYASITQIGLMFIEVAAGLQTLALVHFIGNAFLRTYQLLVSPSVISYLIRDQFFNFTPRPLTFEDYVPRRIENTFFILCLQEWNLDTFIYRIYWRPLKWAGNLFRHFTLRGILIFFVPSYLAGLYFVYHKELVGENFNLLLPFIFSLTGLIMVLRSFAEKNNVLLSWILVIMNHFWIALAIAFNENFRFEHIHLYLSGIVLSGFVGFLALVRLKTFEYHVDLVGYQGYAYKHPKIGMLFLIACLGMSGFPITPTFIGEDLIFSHIHEDQFVVALIVIISFITDGLSIIRMYSKIFMGPHIHSQNEMAFKSS